MKKWLLRIALAVVLLAIGFGMLVWVLTYHPADVEAQEVACRSDAPVMPAGYTPKVLSWNVQFMASKEYVFWFDILDESGPDLRPSSESIATTIAEVARVIRDENPDLVLLQEVDQGAARTDYQDQLALLMDALPADFSCHSSAYYWKAGFVPHPKVMGATGMMLSTISKFRITEAQRHQLPLMPANPVVQQFQLKRAILASVLPIQGGKEFVVMNTHLDAFAQGTDTMQRQVAEVHQLLKAETEKGRPWLIGGDFNLLPPGDQYANLKPRFQIYYQPQSEIRVLLDDFGSVPDVSQLATTRNSAWFTHFPNDPAGGKLDRTIDYLFYSPRLSAIEASVRQHDTQHISDHLPVIARFEMR